MYNRHTLAQPHRHLHLERRCCGTQESSQVLSYRPGLTLSHRGDAVLGSFFFFFASHSGRSIFLAVIGLYRLWNAVFIAGSDSSGDDRCLLPPHYHHHYPSSSSCVPPGNSGWRGTCGTPKSPWQGQTMNWMYLEKLSTHFLYFI